ncbi:hypothetical protein ACGK9U_12550 [Mariniflexile sp. HNIBRBA6329]|uniref:hypothetical protein n=1 Tax=Mariniflexile sp. HNIBRBA6329 TaxID=3373088 RepID=UPI0037477680
MKFENSPHSKKYNYTKKELDFGNYYFLDKIVIAEINYGVHFNEKKIAAVIEKIFEHYNSDCKLGYISNRINSYSFEPDLWKKFFDEFNFIVGSVSVCYTNMNLMNASIEKRFSKKNVKITDNLDDAFTWVLSLKELN